MKTTNDRSVQGSDLPDLVNGPQPVPYSAPTPVELTDAVLQLANEQHADIIAKTQKLSVVDIPGTKPADFPTADAVTLMHTLNVPLTDGFITVKRIYTALEVMIRNYDRSHTDEFFEAAPQLIILGSGETEEMLTTAYLRRNYRKFAKRVAHRVWLYRNTIMLYSASLANMFTLYSYFGTSRTKRLATDFRWTMINKEFNSYQQWVKPIGLEAYLQKYTTFAGGRSSFGAPMISVPYWDTSIYGNQSLRSLHPFNLMDVTKKYVFDETFQDLVEEDVTTARTLLDNIERAIMEYGDYNDAPHSSEAHLNETMFKKAPCFIPENGFSDFIVGGSNDPTIANEVGSSYNRSQSFVTSNDDPQADTHTTRAGKLASATMAQIRRWRKIVETQFPEFANPGNDWYDFFTGGQFAAFTGIKLFEPSLTLSQWKSWADNRPSVNMMDLANAMVHKRDNRASQATIVRFVPYLDDSLDVVRDNFERYDVDADSISAQIASAQKWPSITPSVFSYGVKASQLHDNDASVASFVFNSLPFLNDDTNITSTLYDSKGRYMAPATMVGSHVALLDSVQAAQLDTDDSALDIVGLSMDAAKEWAAKFDGKSAYEFPTHIFVDQVAVLNTSDPMQCGFSILLSADDAHPSEWAKTLLNLKDNAAIPLKVAGGELFSADYYEDWMNNNIQTLADNNMIPCVAGNYEGTESNVPASSAIPSYMRMTKDVRIFCGLNCFALPQQVARMEQESYFKNRINISKHPALMLLLNQVYEHFNDEVLPPGPVGNLIATMKATSYQQGAGVFANPMLNMLSLSKPTDWVYWDSYLYSPDYPPVQPALVPMSDDYYEDYIPTFSEGQAYDVLNPLPKNQWSPLAISDVTLEEDSLRLFAPPEGWRKFKQRNNNSNAQNSKWMWWLRAYYYRALLTGYDYEPKLAEEVTVASPTTGRESTSLSLSQRTRVEFIGSIDLPSIADIISGFSTDSSIRDAGYGVSVGELPTIFDNQYILPEPRKDARTTRPGKPAYTFTAKTFGEAKTRVGKIMESFNTDKGDNDGNKSAKQDNFRRSSGKKNFNKGKSKRKSKESPERISRTDEDYKDRTVNDEFITSGNTITTKSKMVSESDRKRAKDESRNPVAGSSSIV